MTDEDYKTCVIWETGVAVGITIMYWIFVAHF